MCLIPGDGAGEVVDVVCEVEGEENTGMEFKEHQNKDMTDERIIFEKTHKDSFFHEPCEVRMSEM